MADTTNSDESAIVRHVDAAIADGRAETLIPVIQFMFRETDRLLTAFEKNVDVEEYVQ